MLGFHGLAMKVQEGQGYLGVSIVMGVPKKIAGWFISWKIWRIR
jgi:hypothetical protein